MSLALSPKPMRRYSAPMKELPAPSQITADDVATAAGVSRWTVARAFKKDASISERAREKVMRAAENLGYVPDLLASSLASDRSNLIALVADDFTNPHKLVMLERLTRIFRKAGYGTVLVNMAEDDDHGAALISASQMRVDATLVIGTRFDEKVLDTALTARRVKKLIIFARVSAHPQTISVACDDERAMSDIARHLFVKDYTRPLYVAGPDRQSARLNRQEGFSRAWRALQGALPEVMHVSQYDLIAASEEITEALQGVARDRLPDVLVCENDIVAIGAIDALRHRLGLRVPEDVAVTGFDDIPLAAAAGYQLTSYRQPITKMAEAVVALLESGSTEDVILEGHLVDRASA